MRGGPVLDVIYGLRYVRWRPRPWTTSTGSATGLAILARKAGHSTAVGLRVILCPAVEDLLPRSTAMAVGRAS